MLTLRPHLVVSRLHGYYAEVPGHLAPDFFSILFLFFFFLFRPTDPKSENAFDKKRKKKRGWPLQEIKRFLLCFGATFEQLFRKIVDFHDTQLETV